MSQQEVGAEPAAIESGRRREVGWWRRPWWDWDPNEEPLYSISLFLYWSLMFFLMNSCRVSSCFSPQALTSKHLALVLGSVNPRFAIKVHYM